MKILVVEDDAPLAAFIRQALQSESYAADIALDGEQASSMALDLEYDLVLLDLNLPKMDGMAVLRNLRPSKPQLPVLVLTARSRVEDRVQVLDSGADDCLNKPFSYSELSARVRALLRRGRQVSQSQLRVGDLQLDRVERTVERGGQKIDLTTKEFSLLEYLMRNTGRRITRSMIIEHVWNINFDTSTNVVDVYINYSSAQVDKEKMKQLAAAIQSGFQQLGAFQGMGQGTGGDVGGTVPVLPRNEKSLAQQPAIPDAELRRRLEPLRRQFEQEMHNEITRHTVSLHEEPEGLVIRLHEVGFFDSGSAQLRAAAVPAFARIASLLQQSGCNLRVEGHTDNIPIHNPLFNSNWELSTARATEVTRLLITTYNMNPERLSAAGYAEFHPIASNDGEDGRRQNRRVDIIVLRPQILGEGSLKRAANGGPAMVVSH